MYDQMQEQTTRPLKSMALTEAEATRFKMWVEDQPTQIDAADTLGVRRGTIARVLAFKTGSPETIGKIKAVIGVETAQSC